MPPANGPRPDIPSLQRAVRPGCAHWGPGGALRTAQSWAVSNDCRNRLDLKVRVSS
jgi:hypothetical protein